MEKRTADREPAEFAATCHSMGEASQARLHNISPHGCHLETAEAILAPGNKARIKIAGISTLDGRIAWEEGRHAGIEFATALHPAVVAYIADKAAAAAGEEPAARRTG